MLGWSAIFLVTALVAAALGFWALAGLGAAIAKALFIASLAILVLRFIEQAARGEWPSS